MYVRLSVGKLFIVAIMSLTITSPKQTSVLIAVCKNLNSHKIIFLMETGLSIVFTSYFH